ncbi:hypothetical protein LCGC14_0428800 [marine sediment metagenome]|uniref:Uncharacterized protein n=1 Tax=marine sediment metagenome TaxID=412755 RepID=A0A0F9T6Q5_9ZZZZ
MGKHKKAANRLRKQRRELLEAFKREWKECCKRHTHEIEVGNTGAFPEGQCHILAWVIRRMEGE